MDHLTLPPRTMKLLAYCAVGVLLFISTSVMAMSVWGYAFNSMLNNGVAIGFDEQFDFDGIDQSEQENNSDLTDEERQAFMDMEIPRDADDEISDSIAPSNNGQPEANMNTGGSSADVSPTPSAMTDADREAIMNSEVPN